MFTFSWPESMRVGSACLLMAVLLPSACDRSNDPSSDVSADSSIEFSVTGRDTAAVQLLWTSTDLGRPNALALKHDTLVVGDRTRLHFLTTEGEHIATVGRRGEGPEEFQTISALGTESERLVVLDSRNARYTVLDLGGQFSDTRAIEWPAQFGNPMRTPEILRSVDGGMLRLATGSVQVDGPRQLGLLWESLESDSARLIAAWDDVEFTQAGEMLAPKAAFGPRAIVAVEPDGGYVHGNGISHCFSRFKSDDTAAGQFCGPRAAKQIGPGARRGSIDDIPGELPPAAIDALTAIMQMQELGTDYPVYDHLSVSETGDVWMRLISEFQPDVHPVLLPRLPPEQRAQYTLWDVVPPAGGAARAVVFPASFTPKVFVSDTAYGFLELPTGELAVALATWSGT